MESTITSNEIAKDPSYKQGSTMLTIEKLARQAAQETKKKDGDGDGKVNDGTAKETKVKKKKDKPLGTIQGAYVADAAGATSEERAAKKIQERFGDKKDMGAYDDLLVGMAPYNQQIQKRIRKGATRQAQRGALRHLSNLDPTRQDKYEGIVGLMTGLGASDTSDKEQEVADLYKKKIHKYQDKVKDPEGGEVTSRETPWHMIMQGRMANLDSDVAGHKYHRKETPLQYWLNPFDRTGPFNELGDRAIRRMTAGIAAPDGTVGRFAMNTFPFASLIMGGEKAKQKLRRSAYNNDIYAPEAKPDVAEMGKQAALMVKLSFKIPPEVMEQMKSIKTEHGNALKSMLVGGAGAGIGGLMGAGTAAGGVIGGLKGLLSDPGEDEEGNRKSRLMAALKGTLGGGALGAAGGLAAGGLAAGARGLAGALGGRAGGMAALKGTLGGRALGALGGRAGGMAALKGTLKGTLGGGALGALGKQSGGMQAARLFHEKVSIDQLGKQAAGRCWEGYKPVPGKKPYSDGSCAPVSRSKGDKAKDKREKKKSA